MRSGLHYTLSVNLWSLNLRSWQCTGLVCSLLGRSCVWEIPGQAISENWTLLFPQSNAIAGHIASDVDVDVASIDYHLTLILRHTIFNLIQWNKSLLKRSFSLLRYKRNDYMYLFLWRGLNICIWYMFIYATLNKCKLSSLFRKALRMCRCPIKDPYVNWKQLRLKHNIIVSFYNDSPNKYKTLKCKIFGQLYQCTTNVLLLISSLWR